jgi:formylglycine-generating enzyme required for sulfatase activity
VAQFRAFRTNHEFGDKFEKDERCPVSWVSCYDATAYCNSLSCKEGFQECYEIPTGSKDSFLVLQDRDGYRLPTEQEWEFACRAGAKTKCSYGVPDEELANNYAWWFDNARREGVHLSFPVASLKPNDFGLFDMHGNVAEWCQDSSVKPVPGAEKPYGVRGGSFRSGFRDLGSTLGFPAAGHRQEDFIGFRLVRTVH